MYNIWLNFSNIKNDRHHKCLFENYILANEIHREYSTFVSLVSRFFTSSDF